MWKSTQTMHLTTQERKNGKDVFRWFRFFPSVFGYFETGLSQLTQLMKRHYFINVVASTELKNQSVNVESSVVKTRDGRKLNFCFAISVIIYLTSAQNMISNYTTKTTKQQTNFKQLHREDRGV